MMILKKIRDFFKEIRSSGINLKHILILIILVGIILRIPLIFNSNTGWDAPHYIAMGKGLTEHGEFIMEWGDFGSDNLSSTHSHVFPPLFPIYLSGFYVIFGYSFFITKVASVILSLLFLVVAYFTTKSLYDKSKALIVTAFFSVNYTLIFSTKTVYSENIVMLFFMLTLWALIKGIDDDKYMVWAGLFAGLGFLTKASAGPFFIIPAGLIFSWRFYYLRWEVFKRKNYILAVLILMVIVILWSLRNVLLFGFPNFGTSYHIQQAINTAFANPTQYFINIILSLFTLLVIILSIALFFGIELKASFRKIKEEHCSGLWIAILIIILTGIFILGALPFIEKPTVFSTNRIRFAIVALIPLSWLFVKDSDFQINRELKWVKIMEIFQWVKNTVSNVRLLGIILLSLIIAVVALVLIKSTYIFIFLVIGALFLGVKSPKKRLLVMLILLLILSVNTVTAINYTGPEEIGKDLKNHIGENAIVAIHTDNKYATYPYIENINFNVIKYQSGSNADWIISNKRISDENYTLYKEYKNHNSLGIIFLLKHLITSGESPQAYFDRDPEYFLYKHI